MDLKIDTAPTIAGQGADIPRLGLGTFQLRGDTCVDIVSRALRLGYAHVDTAQGYGNETEVGEGIAASGVPRDRVFVTTKVQPQFLAEGDLQRSVDDSLKRLGVNQIDLLLLHWPNPKIPLAGTIRAFNQVKRQGLVRHIGLSNFPVALLEAAIRLSSEPFATEQIEYHPYLDQTKLLATLRSHGMAITAYSPIALGHVVGDRTIEAIAAARGRTPAQICLRWLIQQPGVIAIPRTSKPHRLVENASIFDFELSADEMAVMSTLTRPGSRLIREPEWVPDADWD